MRPMHARATMTDAPAASRSIVRDTPVVLEFTGPGALACLQGLVSNDLVRAGESSLTYAGILTPKGLLITDCWIIRVAGRIVMVAPRAAHEELVAVFRRSLPPRLATVRDHTGAWGTLWGWGGDARAATGATTDGVLLTAWRAPRPWFDTLVAGPGPALDREVRAMLDTGTVLRDQAWALERRLLAGWPRLGHEIDGKTLVQEVRFDENGGVSYDKGCYTGQETVARLHFRGHTNRTLRGIAWEEAAGAADDVELEGRVVGRITSRLETPGRRVGLALVRREVDNGARVLAGGTPATIVALPFEGAPAT